MIRYKTRALVNKAGVPIVELARWGLGARAFLHADLIGEVHEKEVVLKPYPFINVCNCNAELCFIFVRGAWEQTFCWPESVPQKVWDAMLADIERQGGAINVSGNYRVLSAVVRRFIESKKVQDWLRQVAKENGFEVIEEDPEQANGDG